MRTHDLGPPKGKEDASDLRLHANSSDVTTDKLAAHARAFRKAEYFGIAVHKDSHRSIARGERPTQRAAILRVPAGAKHPAGEAGRSVPVNCPRLCDVFFASSSPFDRATHLRFAAVAPRGYG